MNKMNKRAEITTKEIIEIVLTIVAILMLAGLIYLLVSNYFNDKELDEAKASLNFLTAQISNGAKTVVIYNPKNWAVVSWEENMPNLCPAKTEEDGKKCLCICKIPAGAVKTFMSTCSKPRIGKTVGVCTESSFFVEGTLWRRIIEIKNLPVILEIDQDNKIIGIGK